MSSLNKVMVIGYLGNNPEIRYTQAGMKIASLSVATSESWKDKITLERKSKTEWHRIVCMNEKISDVIEKYLKKGSKVYIEGKIQSRKYTDKSGNEQSITEILIPSFGGTLTLLDKKEDAEGGYYNEGSGNTQAVASPKPKVAYDDLIDDDIPF